MNIYIYNPSLIRPTSSESSLPFRGPCRSFCVIFPFNDIVELLPFSADCCPDKLTTISPFCPALPLCICAPVISFRPVRLIQYDTCVPLSLVWNLAHPVRSNPLEELLLCPIESQKMSLPPVLEVSPKTRRLH